MLGYEIGRGWHPDYAVVVPEKQQKVAESIIHDLAEMNWYKKRPKFIDITKNIYPQLYGIKPFKKRKKK